LGAVAAFTSGFSVGMQNPACFVAGTMILTATGLVAIESIKAGDKVVSTNSETFETAHKTVLETYIRKVDKLVYLTIAGALIITTVDHPFYVRNQDFVSAAELHIGYETVDSNGVISVIEDVRIENTEITTVYNFQVEDFHTYYVSELGILVHNASNDYGTDWSGDITDNITSQGEADVYKQAGLKEGDVGGRKALVRDDIDFNSTENLNRLNGKPPKSPVNTNGDVIELHHVGQNPDAPLAELTQTQHRSAGNNTVLHDTSSDYVSKIDRKVFAQEKRDYWALRKKGQ